FYLKQVAAVPSFRQRRAVRKLCRDFLISPEGFRLKMEESEIKRHTMVDSTTLRTLVAGRFLRANQTHAGTYYELSHDSLINAVLGSSRWSLAFRAGWYLVVGIFSMILGIGGLISAFAVPIVLPIFFVIDQEYKGTLLGDILFVAIILCLYGL